MSVIRKSLEYSVSISCSSQSTNAPSMSLIKKPFDKSWIKVTRSNFDDVLYEVKVVGKGHTIVLCKGFIYYQSYEDQSFIQHGLDDSIHPDKLEP